MKTWQIIGGIAILGGVFMTAKKVIAEESGIQFYETVRTYKSAFFPHIPISLVFGIMEQESSFNPDAYRYEAHIKDASYGLMQILHSTAKWMGYAGEPEGLYDPLTNIYYGMKYLSYLMGQFPGNQEGYIMAYNIGPAGYRKGRRNNHYYSRVTTYAAKWAATFAERGLLD